MSWAIDSPCWLLRFGVEIKPEGSSQNMFRSGDLNGEVFGYYHQNLQ